MKICLIEAELLNADKQTDGHNLMKLIISFHNFANAPKNLCLPAAVYHFPSCINISLILLGYHGSSCLSFT